MNEHVDYQVKSSYGNQFLWWCAGADPQILKYSSNSDHVKYAGIGGVVLATAVLAFLSMGFAMHIIFDGRMLVTIPVALVWAVIIFNLDRFIVSSTGKGDGKEGMGFFESINALPRLIMAVLIGFCISAPLETYIFQKEIQREWQLSMDQLALSKTYEIMQEEIQNDSSKIQDYNRKKDEVSAQRETWKKANQAWEDQMQGRGNAEVGIGPRTKALKDEEVIAKKRLDELEANLQVLEQERISNKARIKARQDSVSQLTKSSTPGFLDQIMMLERLSGHGKSVPKFDPSTNQIVKGQEIEIFGSAFWPIWMVRLLFMMLEIAPVLLKLMLVKGPYDYMSENINQILETKQGISIEHVKNEHKKITKFKTNHNPNRIIKIIERQNQRELENAIEAIDTFAEKEKQDIKENPEKYIKDSDESDKA
jgi:hypothetical protein